MKSVLLSIRPYWLFLIIAKKIGWNTQKEKTIEVRKTYPKDKYWDKKVILYCTKDYESINKIPIEYRMLMRLLMGKVIGEFVCDKIVYVVSHPDIFAKHTLFHEAAIKASCLTDEEAEIYSNGKDVYGWHISNLKIYDEPKEVSEFRKPCIYGEESEVSCFTCDKSGYAPDMHIDCFNIVTRPPQSWCYVEGWEE